MSQTLLVTGGTGFIGSAVARVLTTHRSDVDVVWAVRSRVPTLAGHGARAVAVDVTNPSTVRGIAHGVDAVIHLAHLITGSAENLHAVNDTAAQAIADEAVTTGARLVSVSTASVYGPGPWDGADIHALPEAPTSLVSATRAAGDHHILDAGGIVLRPHLVLGDGDRWVIPRAAELVRQFGWPIIGTALHTVIHVNDLATRLVALALDQAARPGVWLASAPEPAYLYPWIAARLRHEHQRPAKSVVNPATAIQSMPAHQRQRLTHDLHLIATDHYLRCGHV